MPSPLMRIMLLTRKDKELPQWVKIAKRRGCSASGQGHMQGHIHGHMQCYMALAAYR